MAQKKEYFEIFYFLPSDCFTKLEIRSVFLSVAEQIHSASSQVTRFSTLGFFKEA